MINKTKYLIFLLILTAAPAGAQSFSEMVAEDIKEIYGPEAEYQKYEYFLPDSVKAAVEKETGQKFFADKVYMWKVFFRANDSGYVILDNVYGKHNPITFASYFDENGNIISNRILKYRESYGSAVKQPEWNEQFTGKNADSGFELNRDIHSISGATISSNALTKGVHKLALLIDFVITNSQTP